MLLEDSEVSRPSVGFLILSHNRPDQLLRLIRTINALYGNPPIACHHDFRQSPLDLTRFPANVRFVRPSIKTAWGKWSLALATLLALRLLYETADPDYFLLASGADYPTAPPAKVFADLHGADAYIDHFDLELASERNPPAGEPSLAHHRAPHNVRLATNHYMRVQLYLPIIRLRPPPYSSTPQRFPRPGRWTIDLPLKAPWSPFGKNYRCYQGSHWFTGSRRAAQKLLHPSPMDERLQRYYRLRVIPEESYFQTVLANDHSLRLIDRPFRYVNWHGAHPLVLGEQDFDAIIASGAHFSRKFEQDSRVLDMLDEYLGVRALA